MTEWDGRDVVVVGAAGALGSGLCSAFLAAGARVHGLDRAVPREPLDAVVYASVDVLSDESLGGWFDGADVPWAVVNAAGGFAPAADLAELDGDQVRQQFELNLLSAALLTKHALRRMNEAGAGRIVHTSSRAARETSGNGFAYSLSKLGVLHLVEMAARETHGTGVTVNAVVPSVIDTPGNRSAMPEADHGRWPGVADLAAVYVFLASDAAWLISGAAVPVYGRA